MSKPAATLTSSLLALKGRASTAGFTPPPEPPLVRAMPPETSIAGPAAGAAEPLLKARQPSPDAQRRGSKSGKGPRAAALGGGGNGTPAAETVRLSYRMAPSEHRRFALLAAHLGKSKQQVIDEALAAYMARCGSEVAGGTCACLGGTAPGKLGPGELGVERGAASLAMARHGQPSPVASGPIAGAPVAIAAAGEAE